MHINNGSVLIVEHDDAVANLLTLALSDEGYRVDRVASPQEALALFSRGNADAAGVVLSDAAMGPQMEPYTWPDRIHACTRAPVVICSRNPAAYTTGNQPRAYAALLQEPYDLADLIALIASVYTCSAA